MRCKKSENPVELPRMHNSVATTAVSFTHEGRFHPEHSPEKLWGILVRKERWGLSWGGWLILALLGFSSAVFLLLNIHPFLAVTHRVNTNVLVVEGRIFYLSDGLFTPSRRNSSLCLDLMSKRADHF